MHITQKGQVTIPKEIRDKFGFVPDSDIEFVVEENRVYLKVSKKKSHFAKMHGAYKGKFSTEEIMRLTRK